MINRETKGSPLTHAELDSNFATLDKKDIKIISGYSYDEYYSDGKPRFYFNSITKQCVTIIGGRVYDCMGTQTDTIVSQPPSTDPASQPASSG